MTPEQTAEDIYMRYAELVDSDGRAFVAYVVAAIRAAEDTTRERCAEVCDYIATDDSEGDGAWLCAKAIRALSHVQSTHENG